MKRDMYKNNNNKQQINPITLIYKHSINHPVLMWNFPTFYHGFVITGGLFFIFSLRGWD